MTNQEAPEALRLAGLLELAPEDGVEPQTAEDAAAELRRKHVECEALLAERERNLNSIRVCNEIINKKNAELESLTTGYAAARLEIESLQARIKTMAEEHADELMVAHFDGRMRGCSTEPAGEYPALPEPVGKVEVSTTLENSGLRRHKKSPAYTSDQRRAYVDRAMRAAQPAGAQQPGDCGNTPYDEGPFTLAQQPGVAYAAQRASIPCGPLIDNFPPRPEPAIWHEGGGFYNIYQLELFANATHALRASHGQAPAQAVPAAAAGCTRSHPHENMDSACRAKAAIAEMQNMAARGAEATTHDLERFVAMLAAAPTTQPAPQQEAQEVKEPVAWYVTGGSRLLDEDEAKAEARRIGGTARAMPLDTAPKADSQPAPVLTSATGGDWTQPTTVAQRLGDAMQLLCGGKRPPDELVSGWLDNTSEELQSFAASNGPAWAQGIGLIDAAMVMVDQPTEITTIDNPDRDHEHRAVRAPADSVLEDAASAGFFLQLPQRPKPEAPAGTVGLDWDAYSGAQMLAYGRDCSNAAIVATQKQGGL